MQASTLAYMTCEHCGEAFQPVDFVSQRFCSPACRLKAWKARQPVAPLVPVSCAGCHARFMPTNRRHRYCTPKCYRAAHPEKMLAYHRKYQAANRVEREPTPCHRCGSLTLRPKFCSDECADPPRECADCGEPYRKQGPSPFCVLCAEKRVQPPKPKRFARLSRGKAIVRVTQRPKVRTFVAGGCPMCGQPFVALAWTGIRFCSRPCAKRADRELYNRRFRSAPKTEPVFRRKVFERDGWTCRLCRKPIKRDAVVPHPKAATLDHILPLALGGEHVYSNVQTAHFLCNSTKCAEITQLSWAA